MADKGALDLAFLCILGPAVQEATGYTPDLVWDGDKACLSAGKISVQLDWSDFGLCSSCGRPSEAAFIRGVTWAMETLTRQGHAV